MANPVMRGLACPVNQTPTILSVDVGERGSENAGKLILGLIVKGDGSIDTEEGLSVNVGYIQQHQFGKKFVATFSSGTVFTEGLR